MWLKALRRILWGAVAGVALVLVAAQAGWLPATTAQVTAQTGAGPEIGGEFSLLDQEGQRRSWSQFRGKPTAMFFGFTNCPDICPTTLGELSVLLAELGDQGDELQVVLISGDPERDTPDVLDAYLESFDPRIVGLTGTEAEVDAAFSVFKAYREKVPLEDGNYTIDHSAGVYLFDADGAFAGTLDMHETTDVQRQKVERLLDT